MDKAAHRAGWNAKSRRESVGSLELVEVHFVFLDKVEEQKRRRRRRTGGSMHMKMKDCNNSPPASTVITSIPLPSAFPNVLTRRNDVMHRTV